MPLRVALAAVAVVVTSLAAQNPPRIAYRSRIVVHDLATNASRVVHEADGVWEAPNWSRDGTYLLVNSGGRLYRLALRDGAVPEPLPLDPSLRANNDHDFSPDGTQLAISASSTTSPAIAWPISEPWWRRWWGPSSCG